MSDGAPTSLGVRTTAIPGLLVLDLPVHGDNRGWFKENWQRAKMTALGLPDFEPVQNNISFNATPGVTRGIHAEPWDKFVAVAAGRVFGAWVDLREGASFGQVFHCEIDPSVAVFVPRGVGNAFQALVPDTAYSYLVNAHWSEQARAQYTFLNLADPTVAIPWPIPLESAELSAHDREHPLLEEVAPMPPLRTLVLGAGGQLGRALQQQWSDRTDVDFVGRETVDLSRVETLDAVDWGRYSTVVNAAAHTDVDGAETEVGRRSAWAANAVGPAQLARLATQHRLTLVHISSDYVFDGTTAPHHEDEPPAPLGVYGQSKAAGDLAVAATPRHYLLRTSWVVGEGSNFVSTMASLAERGVSPQVVDDQVGRLTFASDLARAVDHLLRTRPAPGTYNVSSAGEPASWAELARAVYELTGHDPDAVTPVSTQEYYRGRDAAPRPLASTLDLSKIGATGFQPVDQHEALAAYLAAMP